MRIPFTDLAPAHAPIVEDVVAAVRETAATSRFIGGPYLERFEEAWARYCGTRYAVGVGNGTDAIELTLRALGVGPGDEVLVPANTFIATAEAVSATGAAPLFVDVDPASLLVTPATLEAGRTPRTAAMIVVHLHGHPADMPRLTAYAERHGLALVEDAAQAHGAFVAPGERAGSAGRAGCFSFYPGKNLGAWGDGGAVVTDDEALAAEVRSLANHGRGDDANHHRVIGRNSRLDAIQAAVLARKLADLDRHNQQRRWLVDRYRAGLGPLADGLVEPHHPDASAWHLLVLRTPDRDTVRQRLHDAGITTGVHYPVPCHLTPAYLRVLTGPLPAAEAAARQVLSLPLWPQMSETQVDHVVDALWQALATPPPPVRRPPAQRRTASRGGRP